MITKAVVRRIFFLAARISDPGSVNTVHAPEPRVRSPKSAQRKGCGLYFGRDQGINGRYLHLNS